MLAVGETPFEQAVARAYCSKVGLGGGSFHVGGSEGPAESVYLGVFRREVLERLGGFNDHYHRAQDWELNFRIRQAGELVWFSPDLAVTYRPRSSWPNWSASSSTPAAGAARSSASTPTPPRPGTWLRRW